MINKMIWPHLFTSLHHKDLSNFSNWCSPRNHRWKARSFRWPIFKAWRHCTSIQTFSHPGFSYSRISFSEPLWETMSTWSTISCKWSVSLSRLILLVDSTRRALTSTQETSRREHHSFSPHSSRRSRPSAICSRTMPLSPIVTSPTATFCTLSSCRTCLSTPSATCSFVETTTELSSISVMSMGTTPSIMHPEKVKWTFSPLWSDKVPRSTRRPISDNHRYTLPLSMVVTTRVDSCWTHRASSAFSTNPIRSVRRHCIYRVRMVTHVWYSCCCTKVHSSPRPMMATRRYTRQRRTGIYQRWVRSCKRMPIWSTRRIVWEWHHCIVQL